MTKKAWLIFAVVCVGLIGGVVYLSTSNKIDVSTVDTQQIQKATAQNGNIAEHTYGNMNSKLILVEYADYQCPGCGASFSMVKSLTEKYKDKMGYIFRNYPLTSAHPNAFAAAATAEAAGLQGKFWEMHDVLFTNQASWKALSGADRTNYFVSEAESLGLDGAKLRSQLDSVDIKRKIEFDLALGKKDGVTGTPGFFIDGKEVGNQDVKDGKLVPADQDSSTPSVWSSADLFETYIIKPAFAAKGISLD
jgi:protein-disulfide isomerase